MCFRGATRQSARLPRCTPMSRKHLAILLLSLQAASCALAGGVAPAEVQAHKDRMVAVQDLKFGIIETLAAGSTHGVAADLDALLPLLEAEVGYWDRTGLADIGELARANLDQVRAVRAPALAGRVDEAAEAWLRVERGCSGCHDLHPERRVTVRGARTGQGR